jgi:hypothetical protein
MLTVNRREKRRMEEFTRYGPSTAARVVGGRPPVASRRGSRGHRLRGRGATSSLGGGCCSEDDLGGKSERLVCVAVLDGQGCGGEAQRGEREGEAFSVELVEVIGKREGGARGCRKPRCGWNPGAVHGGRKTMVPVAAVVQTGDVWSESNSGSVTVALGRAQFGAH